jgi:transcription elongation factor Elf1
MGRNARKRAAKHEAEHHHGVNPPEEGERRPPTRCPRCGSTNIVITPSRAWVPGGSWGGSQVDIICGNCNWQGEMNAGIW